MGGIKGASFLHSPLFSSFTFTITVNQFNLTYSKMQYITIISILTAAVSAYPQLQGSTTTSTDVAAPTTTSSDAVATPTGTDIPSRFPFIAPQDVGGVVVRSTCPMLNTFANHGILPRSGFGITKEDITTAFNLINFDSSMSALFLGQGVFPTFNTTADSFDLNKINQHNKNVEHSASLVRDDIYFHNDALTTNQTLVQGLIASSTDGENISFDDLVAWRKVRVADSIARNPTFTSKDFGLTQGFIASGESTILLTAFGNGVQKIPLDAINSFLGQNRFPDGYVTPKEVTSVTHILPTIASVFLKSYPLQFLNPFSNWFAELQKFFHQ